MTGKSKLLSISMFISRTMLVLTVINLIVLGA